VCFDCHAEIESKGPRGRHFTKEELHILKRSWLQLCRDRPEALIRSAQTAVAEAGPLEALLSEIEYDQVVIDEPLDRAIPFLATAQFDRAIAANALGALDAATRLTLLKTYKLVSEANRLTDKLTHLTPEGTRGSATLRSTDSVLKQHRTDLLAALPAAYGALATALGRPAGSGAPGG
jgi:hypothetical protein